MLIDGGIRENEPVKAYDSAQGTNQICDNQQLI